MGFFVKNPCRTPYADGCSERIDIRDLVSHDDHIFVASDKFAKCMCLYSCFYTRALFHLLGLAAVVRNFIVIFYDCLITAASKSKLNGNS